MLKTFWTGVGGWVDEQSSDGTLTWRSPTGRTYTTKPGGSLFFPLLATPTGEVKVEKRAVQPEESRGVMMPRRKRTRKQARDERIAAERQVNQQLIKRQQRLFAELENADKNAAPTTRHRSNTSAA